MKTLIAVVTLIQFFAASAMGSCIISWREMNCDPSVLAVCSQPEEQPARGCCARPVACQPEKPKPCQDKTRVVWSIILSLNPSIVPCCADVSLAPQLTDFYERERASDNSPNMVMTGPVTISQTVHPHIEALGIALPQGLPPPVSITILRC